MSDVENEVSRPSDVLDPEDYVWLDGTTLLAGDWVTIAVGEACEDSAVVKLFPADDVSCALLFVRSGSVPTVEVMLLYSPTGDVATAVEDPAMAAEDVASPENAALAAEDDDIAPEGDAIALEDVIIAPEDAAIAVEDVAMLEDATMATEDVTMPEDAAMAPEE
ncbi:hypothetical protein NA56DRAFT_706191 [Hyaloscypha hepaticicola]|uniref:Uncharacterized protein n=1 Tax=Hyaloscypha hepaticicola TaxID=2082293 RepID=A0A2J6PYN8_9HELO|nr:hypothetical protein NA56DRAFT_706191 [Hyaloscypha hepaticicola]